MMTCRACRLPAEKQGELSLMIASGDSSRAIAARVGLSHDAILRHRRKCIGKALAVVVEAQVVARAETFVEGIHNRIDDARRVGEKAEAIGDLRCALAAFKTMAEIATKLEEMVSGSADEAEEIPVRFSFPGSGALAAARAAGYTGSATDTAADCIPATVEAAQPIVERQPERIVVAAEPPPPLGLTFSTVRPARRTDDE